MAPRYQKIFSVGELNENVHRLLSSELRNIFIKGEISNLARPTSGHIYFTLKDRNAQVKCALFKNRINGPTDSIDNGLEIIVNGTPSIYTVRGDYQIIVDYLETAGEGLLRRKFDELKRKLMKEGLFESSLKKPIEKWPIKIGIITSPTGAAIRDILSVIRRRAPSIPIVIYPCQVQGKFASSTIVSAIETANLRQECSSIILTRGGGSLEDLWAFNEEITARAINRSKIPIISAIGHETDFTISDMVADMRAATPSAAAELASPDMKQAAIIFRNIYKRLRTAIELLFKEKYTKLLDKKNLLVNPENKVLVNIQLNDELSKKLCEFIDNKFKQARLSLAYLNMNLIQTKPKSLLTEKTKTLAQLKVTSLELIMRKIQNLTLKTQTTNAILTSNNPKSILKRGYSITQGPDHKVVKDVSSLKMDSKITTTFHRGSVVSKVESFSE